MEEFVGYCASCGKEVYCKDGFLDGIVTEDKQLYCFTCGEDK
ncbi:MULTISPECIES: hypothetical protein [Salimicrobium]|uniref:Uncharacterized protein n=2 Tax=Salimicrobium TaxID=351195 RepID=K2G9V9_9BACI|nr:MULTISPECIES: hypothetical protein [Salimicrobium]EKE31127.1 hypothetical protein MJ3_09867 [Salimicrobium jeotgali]MBM7697289.1 hypothetical protein [Salimicrobium jeotgali]SDY21648.1 hypothetical protein SAMN04488081_2375 [Salimicrobium album]